MNPKSTIIVLVAALAVLSGAMGMSMTGAFSDQGIMTASTGNAATGMLIGHVAIEGRHADGELFAYRQLDNAVVNDGEQCILKMLFESQSIGAAGRGGATTFGSGACTGVLQGAWDVIAIGKCTDCQAPSGADKPVDTDVLLKTEVVNNGGERGLATSKVWTNGTFPQIVMSRTFTADGGDIGAVTESGLFNATGANANGMLARNSFAAVTINDGDSITITWTFKVGD
jgi:hypothetical protein